MRRMVGAALCSLLAVLLLGGTTAFASVDGLTVDRTVELTLENTVVIVTGLVQCTAGDDMHISASVLQVQGRGLVSAFGSTTLTCSGSADVWTILVTAIPVDSFKSGPAEAAVTAFDNTDGDFQSVRTRIHLKK